MLKRNDYTFERYPGQYAYHGTFPNVGEAVCRHVTIRARGPPVLGVEHTITLSFDRTIDRQQAPTCQEENTPIVTVRTHIAHEDEHDEIAESYLPLLLRELSFLDGRHRIKGCHSMKRSGANTSGVIAPDGPWTVAPDTLVARATGYQIGQLRELSFNDRPWRGEPSFRPWEHDVLKRLPPLLGQTVSIRCEYEHTTSSSFAIERYDRSQELLDSLKPRDRTLFDLYWGVTSGERLSPERIEQQIGKTKPQQQRAIHRVYETTDCTFPRPLDVTVNP